MDRDHCRSELPLGPLQYKPEFLMWTVIGSSIRSAGLTLHLTWVDLWVMERTVRYGAKKVVKEGRTCRSARERLQELRGRRGDKIE